MSTLAIHNLQLGVRDRTLCDDLSVLFNAGEAWAILGPNGSGKTTLLHTLAGLCHPIAGKIRLGEHDIFNLPPRQRARLLGLLPQEHTDVFPGTVAEAVLAGRHPYKGLWQWENEGDYRAMQTALRQVDLEGLEQRRLTSLSGGERQRVAIATLLVQAPPIMLLDEPTNHLDPKHQLLLLRHLQVLVQTQGRGAIMVLHDFNLAARFCTHAILLYGDGRCLAGSVSEVVQEEPLSQLYDCQIQRLELDGRVIFYGA